jgi:hypothetical protein
MFHLQYFRAQGGFNEGILVGRVTGHLNLNHKNVFFLQEKGQNETSTQLMPPL